MDFESALRWCCRLYVCAALLPVLVGCGDDSPEDRPTTYQVKGRLQRGEGASVTNEYKMVEMINVSGGPRVFGMIDTDGTFTLETMTDSGDKFDGAPAGIYHVTIHPDMSQDQTQVTDDPPEPIQLQQAVEIKESHDNELTLKLP